jgi:tetratricopeptide (TPR) repeat protein
MKIAAISISALACLSAAAAGEAPALPPGHPKLDGPPSARPALGTQSGELPPGHPSVSATAGSESSAEDLPAGHPQARPGNGASSAEEILKRLDSTADLKQREKTFEVALALGKLYYTQGRYADAVEYLGQAAQKAEGARALYLQQRKRAGAVNQIKDGACGSTRPNAMDAQTAAARELSQKGNLTGAQECLRAALEPALEAEELRANALFLTGDSAGALAGYQHALAIDSDRTDSLYGRAMLLFDTRGEDLKALGQVKQDLTRFLQLEPNGAKSGYVRKLLQRTEEAISAGGMMKLAQKRDDARKAAPTSVASRPATPGANQQPPPLSPEVVESIKNTERTPELQEGLAKLVEEGENHLARGRYQEALDAYKRVVPFQPDSGRAKAGMAWALVGLQKQPMADRVWSVAVGADPAAVEKLGDALAGKGDKAGAKALWKKLAETAPTYAQSSGLAGKLR